MKYHTYKPPLTLTNTVYQYWSLEGKIPKGQHYIHRTLANIYPEMIFHFGGTFYELNDNNDIEKTFATGIHGQTDRIRRFTAIDTYGIFGILLQPYSFPLLFDIPSSAIKNGLIDLTSALGKAGAILSEQILNAKDDAARIQIINQFLERRLKEYSRPGIIPAIEQIYQLNGLVDVKWIAKQSNLSQRQFERNFKDLVGFSPKTFARLVRFKSLIANYSKKDKSLTQVAYDFGYCDQSHFIHEFKSFSGYTPNAYFSGRATEVFYAPLE